MGTPAVPSATSTLAQRRRQFRLALAVLCLAVLALAGGELLLQRETLKAEALQQAKFYARALAAETSRTLGSASSTLRLIAESSPAANRSSQPVAFVRLLADQLKIGRASCRERV